MKNQARKTWSHGEFFATRKPTVYLAPKLSGVYSLQDEDTQEVLAFLAKRPVHTVVMYSWIRDNGIVSPLNRGAFYGYRNESGELEGVALIGHATLIEARSEESLAAFALRARTSEVALHFLIAPGDSIETFWDYYAEDGRAPRLRCTELMFEMKFPVPLRNSVEGLRKATAEDLLMVAEAHAQIAFEESGVNPLLRDREKFLERTLRRIEKGWCWVVVQDGQLIFKTDVVAQTSEVTYLEGIYVAPEERGKGVGADCLSQVSRKLLMETKAICLLSNANFQHAHNTYRKVGFKIKDKYETIFV
jgi:hypothetical protein